MSTKYGPYSPVRRAGNYYYVSGQVGVDPATKQAATDVSDQARQALENLRAVLAEDGLGLADVAKTTVFLTDMADFRSSERGICLVLLRSVFRALVRRSRWPAACGIRPRC